MSSPYDWDTDPDLGSPPQPLPFHDRLDLAKDEAIRMFEKGGTASDTVSLYAAARWTTSRLEGGGPDDETRDFDALAAALLAWADGV